MKIILDLLKLSLIGLSIYNLFLSNNFYWIFVAIYWLINFLDGKVNKLK